MAGLLRKMSTKSIMAEAEVDGWEKIPDGVKQKFLYTIGGMAVGVKKGEGAYGVWTRFNGEFAAVVPGRKEAIESTAVFLPEPFSSQLESAISRSTGGVEFAINVFIRPPTKDENVKYVYLIEPVIKVQESSAAKKLLETMQAAAQKALPEPVKETTAATAHRTPPKK